MTREVYIKKPNGRYESLGQDWTGFPANGIWLVQDGKQNCLIQLKDMMFQTNLRKNL